jgi:hypothetical protein
MTLKIPIPAYLTLSEIVIIIDKLNEYLDKNYKAILETETGSINIVKKNKNE